MLLAKIANFGHPARSFAGAQPQADWHTNAWNPCIARWKQQVRAELSAGDRPSSTDITCRNRDGELEAIERRGVRCGSVPYGWQSLGRMADGRDVGKRRRDEKRWRVGKRRRAIARLGQVTGIARIAGYAVETCTGTADHQQMRHADSQAGVAYRRAGTRAADVHPVMRANTHETPGTYGRRRPDFRRRRPTCPKRYAQTASRRSQDKSIAMRVLCGGC